MRQTRSQIEIKIASLVRSREKFALALVIITLTSLGYPAQADYLKPSLRLIDGIKVQSATRVQAGKYFQVKLSSKSNKISGICWMEWSQSKGFNIPKAVKMVEGQATVKILPVEPGAGEMFFYCGKSRNDASAGGSNQIYIAP